MATLYNKWEEAKKSNQPVENVQKLIDVVIEKGQLHSPPCKHKNRMLALPFTRPFPL